MSAIIESFSNPTWRHLTLALLHTLWQGPLLTALLWIVLRWIPVRRSEARYAVSFFVLIGLLVAGIATWSVMDMEWTSGNADIASARIGGEAEGVRVVAVGNAGVMPVRGNNDLHIKNGQPQPVLPEWPLAWLTVLWLLGVGLMSGRMAWRFTRLRRLARATEMVNPLIQQWTEELCRAFGIARMPRIVEAGEGIGPAIFGVIRPVLALPVAMATGLPPDSVRAVIAHELAHLRRYDYWFNLVQMAVESVLFFNPAVWWISRQVRIERESSCDMLAARALDHPVSMAEALSAWGERSLMQSGAVSFTSSCRGLLLDRVRRLLLPGYRPQMSISLFGLLGMFIGSAAVLTVLFYGTSAAVEIAARILTPRERIEKVEETRRQYAAPTMISPAENNDEKVVIRGTIRTYDNKPLPKDMVMLAHSQAFQRNDSYTGTCLATPPKFTVSIRSGVIWLSATREGYAPAVAGPIYGEPGKSFSDVEMVLQKGEPRTVRVVDEDGNPVPQVKITGSTNVADISFGGIKCRSDDEGNFMILAPPGDKEWLYSFNLSKPGFQSCNQNKVVLHSDSPTTLILHQAVPLPGELLSPDGKPVAGVDIRLYMKVADNWSSMDGKRGPVLGVTDAKGRFTLDCLEDGAMYYLMAESEKYGPLPIVLNADRPKRLALRFGPLLTVSGVIEGPLDGLNKLDRKPSVYYSQPIKLLRKEGNSYESYAQGNAVVETIDGRQCFTIRGLLPGDVFIRADKNHSLNTTVNTETPRREVAFDLRRENPPPVKRPVVLRLVTPDGSIPKGSIRVRTTPATGSYTGRDQRSVAIENGEAHFDAYVGGEMIYSPLGLIGYWFDWEKSGGKIDAGEGPLEIDVPLFPAGAIAGRVIDADGKPVDHAATVEIRGYKEPSMPPFLQYGDFTNYPMSISVDHQGRFWFNPLPFDWIYQLCLRCGHIVCYSSTIELNGSAPTAEVTLTLPRTASVEGRVTDNDGKPLAIPCELSLHTNAIYGGGGAGHGFPFQTDRGGRFRFDDLGVGIGQWSIYFTPQRDYQPLRVELPLDGRPIEARLEPGFVLEGTILDDGSGDPVAGIKLTAIPWPPNPGSVSCKAEAATDEKGRFRFSNLGDRPYWIMAWGGPQLIPAEGAERVTWRPSDLTEVIYRAKIPEWFRRH